MDGLFTDPLFLAGIASAVVIILLIYTITKRMKPLREVIYMRERDRRGQDLTITEETATAILCKSRTGVDKRFFKWGGSYTFSKGGRTITRFLGKEGTAYTYKLQSGRKNQNQSNSENEEEPQIFPANVQCTKCGEIFSYDVEIPSPQKINAIGEELGSLEYCLRTLWGNEFFEQIPEEQKKVLEENKVFVTVELEAGLTPPGFSPVSEDEFNDEQDRNAARIFGRALQSTTKQELYKGFLWAALGALFIFIMFNFGVFH